MSDIDAYDRLMQRQAPEESTRREVDAVNYLLGQAGTLDDRVTSLEGRVDDIEALLNLLYEISLENAILRGSTTWDGTGQLDNYSLSWAPTPIGDYTRNLTYDPAAGTITVEVDGIYTLSGYVIQTGGTNGQEYAVVGTVNGSDTFLVGVNVWANQANGFLNTASSAIGLTAGDVIALRMTNQTALVIVGSNLQVTLETLDAFS
jgi:hypothetical protein